MSEETRSRSPSTSTDSEASLLEELTPARGPKIRKLGDWIESFLEYTSGFPSPRLFRLWAGIACIAGASERRVWATVAEREVYPNLYTLLVAPPAVGKSEAIGPAEYFWQHAKRKGDVNPWLKVAPKSVTRASLVDELSEAQRRIPLNTKEGLIEYSSLCVSAGELGVLIPSHDLDFLSVLNHIYDNPPLHSEKRRTHKINHQIINPQLNILAGTQPAYLANLLPEEAWGMGFMSRQIMVYSGTPVLVDLFPDLLSGPDLFTQALRASLSLDLGQVCELYGKMVWDTEAAEELKRWYKEGMPPVPEHSKLVHYVGRRILHVIKLSIIASMSRGNDLKITLLDLSRARDWLLEVEVSMPDIFREMVGKSDAQVLTELNQFMWQMFALKKREPLHESLLVHFLQTRLPSERIDRVLQIAERAGHMAKMAGTTNMYIPRPKNEHGVE